MNKIDCEDKKVRCKSLFIDGTKYRTTLNKKYEQRKAWSKAEKNKIASFIPGTILKLYVSEGQCVKKGDNLLILEAMKMQNLIKSPIEGIIKSINLKEGERVPKGKIMIEIGFP
ncbi:MAG: acetyl-CoA carboxylase biotin carboxyl carrier protein subunit [Bacteroidales bacterium]